jgi:hypothetical protein
MRRAIWLGLAAIGGLSACNPAEKSYTVKDPQTGEKTKVTVSEKAGDKAVTIKSQDGSGTISVAETGEVPRNLPSYVPAYPGANYQGSFVASSMIASSGGPAAGGMVGFSTKDTPEQVIAFYKAAFVKAGLQEAVSGNFGQMQMLSATKEGSEDGAQVMITQADGVTQVQVIYSALE